MNKLKYRKAWRWPDQVEAFIRSRARGFVVHICSGKSLLGDIRIDSETSEANVKGDLSALPIRDEVADTVICDPPWEMPYHHRGKLAKELRRILKPGAQLLFNAPWSPKQPRLPVIEILVPEYQLMWFRNVALIWVCQKVQGELPLVKGGDE